MDVTSFEILEFPLIIEKVKELCVSNLGKTLCERMQPSSNSERVRTLLQETTEAAALVARGARIDGLYDVSEALKVAEVGGVIIPGDLVKIASVLRGASKFKKAMKARNADAPLLSSYTESIHELPYLVETIEVSIDGERVADSADEELRKVRRAMKIVEGRIQAKMNSITASGALREAIPDPYVTAKNGRYVVPVRASHRHKVPGTVVAASSSGQTVFIEPAAVQPLVDELVTLTAQEEELVYKVLCRLTEEVVAHLSEIRVTAEAMAVFDFTFAKGKYSLETGGVAPDIAPNAVVCLRGARHPLIGKDCVPLDIAIGPGYRTLVVTGPNTGGKTVLLKTVGLFNLMAQSGLHIPAEPRSSLPVFEEVLADIGDRQSIQQSLSTFSSHMANTARILKLAGPRCLVLLDEIGTGTDPREGAALASAILSYLHAKGCVTVATTHYGDVKAFSESRPGFMNGCMEFDHETLEPLYKLSIGKAGESQGITIATRLGLPGEVVDAARTFLAAAGFPGEQKSEDAYAALAGIAGGEPAEDERREPDDETKRAEPHLKPDGSRFRVGDSVYVSTVKYHGVVAREADSKGDVIVLVKDERLKVNWKRLRLLVKREDLYPDFENYDLNIVLTSKGDRRLIREMSRRKTDAVRVIEPDPE